MNTHTNTHTRTHTHAHKHERAPPPLSLSLCLSVSLSVAVPAGLTLGYELLLTTLTDIKARAVAARREREVNYRRLTMVRLCWAGCSPPLSVFLVAAMSWLPK